MFYIDLRIDKLYSFNVLCRSKYVYGFRVVLYDRVMVTSLLLYHHHHVNAKILKHDTVGTGMLTLRIGHFTTGKDPRIDRIGFCVGARTCLHVLE